MYKSSISLLKREHLDGLMRLLHSQLFSKVAQQLINAMPLEVLLHFAERRAHIVFVSPWFRILRLSFFFQLPFVFLKGV